MYFKSILFCDRIIAFWHAIWPTKCHLCSKKSFIYHCDYGRQEDANIRHCSKLLADVIKTDNKYQVNLSNRFVYLFFKSHRQIFFPFGTGTPLRVPTPKSIISIIPSQTQFQNRRNLVGSKQAYSCSK